MAKQPLLMEELNVADRIYLGDMTSRPGYEVLKRIALSARDLAEKQPIKLNPVDPNYSRQLEVMTLYARAVGDFCDDLLNSIKWHVEYALNAEQTEQAEAVALVAKANQI